METFLRIFLPVYLVAFGYFCFYRRKTLVEKKIGKNPIRLTRTDSAHDFVGMVFSLTLMVAALVVILFALSPAGYDVYAGPFRTLENFPLRAIGAALLLASLIFVALAQSQMGESWRVGVDYEQTTPLVHQGLYRFSRNPIYLGMGIMILGYFLALPNVATLMVVVLGFVIMNIQVRLEEEYMRRIHGARFDEYCRQVRRWL